MNELSRARVIAHVDLDAFYVQVEVQRDVNLHGKPVVVVQYNPFGDLSTLVPEAPRQFPDSNGSIIAVGYPARKFGVKRNMMAQEAKKLCPDLVIVQVPVAHGKADLTIYREAGAQVAGILSRLSVCERASIDEVYLDVTEEAQTRLAALPLGEGGPPAPTSWQGIHVIGAETAPGPGTAGDQVSTDEAAAPHDIQQPQPHPQSSCNVTDMAAASWWQRPADQWAPHEALLAAGAQVVYELRKAVESELGYTCSAGISHYKILAKLGSGLHKPAQQTVVPANAVAGLLKDLPLSKLRGLGGDFGQHVEKTLNVKTCGEVWGIPVSKLDSLFGKKGPWLARLVWGIDAQDDIKQRLLPKQLSCGKTFRGAHGLTDLAAVRHWLGELAKEVAERCEADRKENKRIPQTLTVAITNQPANDPNGTNFTRSCPLGQPTAAAMADAGTQLVKKWGADRPGWRLRSMFLSASNFVAAPTGNSTITRFLGSSSTSPQHSSKTGSPAPVGKTGGVIKSGADTKQRTASLSDWLKRQPITNGKAVLLTESDQEPQPSMQDVKQEDDVVHELHDRTELQQHDEGSNMFAGISPQDEASHPGTFIDLYDDVAEESNDSLHLGIKPEQQINQLAENAHSVSQQSLPRSKSPFHIDLTQQPGQSDAQYPSAAGNAPASLQTYSAQHVSAPSEQAATGHMANLHDSEATTHQSDIHAHSQQDAPTQHLASLSEWLPDNTTNSIQGQPYEPLQAQQHNNGLQASPHHDQQHQPSIHGTTEPLPPHPPSKGHVTLHHNQQPNTAPVVHTASWQSLSSNDIDPTVMAELPPEIQRELLSGLSAATQPAATGHKRSKPHGAGADSQRPAKTIKSFFRKVDKK